MTDIKRRAREYLRAGYDDVFHGRGGLLPVYWSEHLEAALDRLDHGLRVEQAVCYEPAPSDESTPHDDRHETPDSAGPPRIGDAVGAGRAAMDAE